MQAGHLDRTIRFERQAEAADDSFSAGQDAWVTVVTVRAQVQDVMPSRAERAGEAVKIANRPARVRIRWRSDITADMRIVYGSRIMQLLGPPAELGRRQWLEMMAEDYSTAGNAA